MPRDSFSFLVNLVTSFNPNPWLVSENMISPWHKIVWMRNAELLRDTREKHLISTTYMIFLEISNFFLNYRKSFKFHFIYKHTYVKMMKVMLSDGKSWCQMISSRNSKPQNRFWLQIEQIMFLMLILFSQSTQC